METLPIPRCRASLRVLVRGLVLFLVPLVIVATPTVADAAVTRGESVTADVSGFSLLPIPGNDMSCSVSGQWVVPEAGSVLVQPSVELGGVSCVAGFSFDNIGGGSESYMDVTVKGDGCEGSASVPIAGFDVATRSFPGPRSAFPGASCSVTTICLDYYSGRSMAGIDWVEKVGRQACTAFPLGLPPEVETIPESEMCAPHPDTYPDETITPIGISWRIGSYPEGSGSNNVESPTLHLAEPAPRAFQMPFWYYHHPSYPRLSGYFSFAAGQSTAEYNGLWGPRPTAARIQLLPGTSIGGNVYNSHPGFDQTRFDGNASPGQVNGIGTGADATPTGVGMFGVSYPKACLFYFGVKVYDDGTPGAGFDEPFGPEGSSSTPVPPVSGGADPVGPPPPPAPGGADDGSASGGCDNFSIFRPSTWAGAGFCELVQALRDLWDLLSGLPEKIASAFGRLFDSWLVPADGYAEASANELRSEWEATAPGAWVDTVTSLDPGSISGCGGVPVTIPIPGIDDVNMHLGAACSGAMADAANITRIAISAGLVIGGGWACVRALGSGFGWSPGVGSREGQA